MSQGIEGAAAIYSCVQGGADLIDWFGHVPSFHDAEIVELSLHRRAPSTLRIHTWITRPEVDQRGSYIQDKHVVVAFRLEGIMDLQLDGFSHQNVISKLILRRAPDRPERQPHYWLDPSPDDLEIELEPCVGLDGRIRCRKVRIDLTPGMPEDANE